MPDRYAVVDADSLVTNVIVWDGSTSYDPGADLTLASVSDDSDVAPGDTVTVDKGDVTVVTKAERTEAEPSIEERLARVEAKTDDMPDGARAAAARG